MDRAVTAFAPASVSNVACGFDIMGFALDRPGDTVTIRFSKTPGVRIRSITGIAPNLPMDASRNTAAAPVSAMLRHCGTGLGAELDIHKGIPASGGIGSSAASAVAATVACNALLEAGLTLDELLPFAVEGEKIASEALHVDNVAPSLRGGFVLIRGYSPIDIIALPVPKDLWCTILHPHMEIETREARKVIPRNIPLGDVVRQTGNAAGLVAGLLQGDFGLIGRSLQDFIAEPVRKTLIPGFDAMKEAALQAGALGCSISGSGPCLFALSTARDTAQEVGNAMGAALHSTGLGSSVYVSGINQTGAYIVPTPDHELSQRP